MKSLTHPINTRAAWRMVEISIYCCLGLHPDANETQEDLLDRPNQELMSSEVATLREVDLDYLSVICESPTRLKL